MAAADQRAAKFLKSIVPIQVGNSRHVNKTVMALASAHTNEYSFDISGGILDAKSLHGFAGDGESDDSRYIYLVFNTDSDSWAAPLTSFDQLEKVSADNTSTSTPSFYFTNDYNATHDKNYVAKLRLYANYSHLFVITEDKAKWASDFCCFRTKVERTQTHTSKKYIETQLIPSPKMMTTAMLKEYVDTKLEIVPVIPSALQTILTLSPTKTTLEKLLSVFMSPGITNNAVLSTESVTITEGTRLHHMTGAVSMPSGGQTNTANKEVKFSNDRYNDKRPELAKFFALYPCFGPVLLSTKAFTSGSAMNGISSARYYVTEDTVLNDERDVKRVLHIYLFDGHVTNDKFRADFPELVQRICGEERCKDNAILVWSTTMKGVTPSKYTTTITSESSVDIVTLQWEKDNSLLARHRSFFVNQSGKAHPPIACEYAMNALFASDFTKLLNTTQ